MTSVVEYSYLDSEFVVKASEEFMNRAVRIKVTVMDKLKRAFEKNVSNNLVENEVSMSKEVPVASPLEALIDLSSENLVNLNDKLNGLLAQEKMSYPSNRAVLFTPALVSKIHRVVDKWFADMPIYEKPVVSSISSELENLKNINHLGGEVVPGTWNVIPEVEKEENPVLPSIEPVAEMPAMEPVLPSVEPVAEMPAMEPVLPNVEPVAEMPAMESVLPSVEPVAEMPAMEPVLPSVEPVAEMPANEPVLPNFDFDSEGIYNLPAFVPGMNNIATVQPVSESEAVMPTLFGNITEEKSNEAFVPEPELVGEVGQTDFVPEPRNLSVEMPTHEMSASSHDEVDMSIETKIAELLKRKREVGNEEASIEPETVSQRIENPVPVEDRIAELVNKEVVPVAEVAVESDVRREPAEDRINELLGRKELVNAEPVAEMPASETVLPSVDEKPKTGFTQASVMARLQRMSNEMKEKDAAIRSLSAKHKESSEQLVALREQLNGNEAVIKDLTSKNSALTKANESLESKLSGGEASYKSTIESLQAQVRELTQSKTEESENSRRIIAELKENHANEIAELKKSHSRELASINESKEKQIQAIYATITDALGDTSMDADYSKGMAA